ncbi:MAG: hypothetical protein FWD96_05995, partial [Defluviitaleaceae bacterium]|nr:hypothetical protein [Defluviitaleaceae bacterium]
MLNRPRCLHIPYLYEGKGVQLSWAVVDDAAGYRLERKVNGTFEDASLGQTWAQLDKAEEAWDQVEYLGLTWATIEALPAIGLAWENLDAQTLTWDEKEVEGLTWQGFESLPHSNVIYS